MYRQLTTFLVIVILALCSCGHKENLKTKVVAPAHRGIYHWKTTYDPTEWELRWMEEHRIDRLYVKFFDVAPGAENGYDDWAMVPVATTRFERPLPRDMEVIPVVYITVDAIRALAESYDFGRNYAELLVKRIEEMTKEHYGGKVKEVQLDCDWTSQTEDVYFALCRHVRKLLHERGITLSGTVRLHQLRQLEQPKEKEDERDEVYVSDMYDTGRDGIPFDRSLLMCYNTGRLQNSKTKNSILDYNDVKPYLAQYSQNELPNCDVAYPVYGWGVEFDTTGNFSRLINSHSLSDTTTMNSHDRMIREEWGEAAEIAKTQKALPKLDKEHTTILFHLDSLNLSKYSHDEIEAIYSR